MNFRSAEKSSDSWQEPWPNYYQQHAAGMAAARPVSAMNERQAADVVMASASRLGPTMDYQGEAAYVVVRGSLAPGGAKVAVRTNQIDDLLRSNRESKQPDERVSGAAQQQRSLSKREPVVHMTRRFYEGMSQKHSKVRQRTMQRPASAFAGSSSSPGSAQLLGWNESSADVGKDFVDFTNSLSPWERSNGSNVAVGGASPPYLAGQRRDVRPTTAHPDMLSSNPDGAVEPSSRRVEYHSSPQRELARLASRTSRAELEALIDQDRLNRLYPSVENENRQKGNFAEAPVVRRHWNARPLSATMRARLRGQPAVARHDTAAMRTMEIHHRQAAAQREAEFMTDELRIVPQGRGRVAEAVYPTSKSRRRLCRRGLTGVQPLLPTDHRKGNARSPTKLMSSMRAVQIPLPQRALKREKVRGSPVHRGGRRRGKKSRRRVSRSKSVAMLSSRARPRLGRRSTSVPALNIARIALEK